MPEGESSKVRCPTQPKHLMDLEILTCQPVLHFCRQPRSTARGRFGLFSCPGLGCCRVCARICTPADKKPERSHRSRSKVSFSSRHRRFQGMKARGKHIILTLCQLVLHHQRSLFLWRTWLFKRSPAKLRGTIRALEMGLGCGILLRV